MTVMVIVRATKNSQAPILPDQKLLTEMGKYNEQIVKAGVMLAAEERTVRHAVARAAGLCTFSSPFHRSLISG